MANDYKENYVQKMVLYIVVVSKTIYQMVKARLLWFLNQLLKVHGSLDYRNRLFIKNLYKLKLYKLINSLNKYYNSKNTVVHL